MHVHLKTDKLDYQVQRQIKKISNVLVLESIPVALTREIGDGPCFFVYKSILDRCEQLKNLLILPTMKFEIISRNSETRFTLLLSMTHESGKKCHKSMRFFLKTCAVI